MLVSHTILLEPRPAKLTLALGASCLHHHNQQQNDCVSVHWDTLVKMTAGFRC